MSRSLLDQNVPFLVRKLLLGHKVKTTFEMGWATLANGDLLKVAADEASAILVICDQNIRYQQNMATRPVG